MKEETHTHFLANCDDILISFLIVRCLSKCFASSRHGSFRTSKWRLSRIFFKDGFSCSIIGGFISFQVAGFPTRFTKNSLVAWLSQVACEAQTYFRSSLLSLLFGVFLYFFNPFWILIFSLTSLSWEIIFLECVVTLHLHLKPAVFYILFSFNQERKVRF